MTCCIRSVLREATLELEVTGYPPRIILRRLSCVLPATSRHKGWVRKQIADAEMDCGSGWIYYLRIPYPSCAGGEWSQRAYDLPTYSRDTTLL